MKEVIKEQDFVCPVYKKCGACQLDVAYPRQLNYKMRLMRETLGRFGKIEKIIGMNEPTHYRCKVSAAFGYTKNHVITGIWQSSNGKIAQVEECALEDKRSYKIIKAIRVLLPKFKLRTYDEATRQGFLRFVTIRIGKQSGEILVALGTSKGKFPQLDDFVKALVTQCPEITTVVRCVSVGKLNLLLGEEESVLFGDGFITDKLCGFDFRISARSFFQVNPTQTEKLYSTAVEMADLSGKETVLDAYCGVGTIGIIASTKAKNIISVELNGDAVENARDNVNINQLKNVKVFKGDAGDFMTDMAARGERLDVVFTDPPRAGCDERLVKYAASLEPKRIVYISCNPTTLARDVALFAPLGYLPGEITPVDLFPGTGHVESVVCLTRK